MTSPSKKGREKSKPHDRNLLIPAQPTPDEVRQKTHAAKLALIDSYYELLFWAREEETLKFVHSLTIKPKGRPKKTELSEADKKLLAFYKDTCRAKRNGLYEDFPDSLYPHDPIPWIAKIWRRTNKDHLSLEATEKHLRRLIRREIERRLDSMTRIYDRDPEHQDEKDNDLREYEQALKEEFGLEGDKK